MSEYNRNSRIVRHVGANTPEGEAKPQSPVKPVQPAKRVTRPQPRPAAREAQGAKTPSSESYDKYRRRSEAPLPEVDAEPLIRERKKAGMDPGDPNGRKPWSSARKVIVILLSLLIVVAIAVGVKYIVDVSNPANLFNNDPIVEATPVPEVTPPQQVTVTPAPGEPAPTPTPDPDALLSGQADLSFMQNRVNVLLLGVDESTERENWGSFRTDTMILVTIDFSTNDVDMISVPRDSYVKLYNASGVQLTNDLDEGKMGKINSAFSEGGGAQKKGYQYACMTVSKLLGGVPINYYVGFNMNVVKQVVDAMGGVDYYVDIPVSMNGRTLEIGQQHLDGQAVLDYCRMRKGSSDIARVERQQNMIMAIFRQLKSTDQIKNIPGIYKAVEANIQTNLDFTQISSLALLALRMEMDQLEKHTVEGGFLNMAGTSYWGVSSSKLKKTVDSVFGIDMKEDLDIDIKNIEAAILANREAIAAELSAANTALGQAEGLLTKYGSLMDAATKENLERAMGNVENAVEHEEKALLDASTPTLQQLVNQLLGIYEPSAIVPPPNTGFNSNIFGNDDVFQNGGSSFDSGFGGSTSGSGFNGFGGF